MQTVGSDAVLSRRPLTSTLSGTDRGFQAVATGSGLAVLAIMTAVGVFLLVRAVDALDIAGWHFLTETHWEPDSKRFGIAAVLLGTVLVGLVAVSIALPLAAGSALFITEYAPRKIAGLLITLVDLMAAVPSVVYGLWGAFYLQDHIFEISRFLARWFSWTWFLDVPGADPTNPLDSITQYKSSVFLAGIVVALMITPIMCSVMRESFSRAPIGEREAALGLGASRWAMIRTVVLPFGKGGIIGGTMLGLGRALGETIAVIMILSIVIGVQPHILKSGGSTVSALIATRYGYSTAIGISALMAAGLALFLMTLVINFAAASVVARSRSGAEST